MTRGAALALAVKLTLDQLGLLFDNAICHPQHG
jgi:hypothetical protein